jgi:hypothetical protein
MKKKSEKTGMRQKCFLPLKWYVVAAVFLVFTVISAPHTQAQFPTGLVVTGVESDGSETDLTTSAYRWLVQEDLTYHVPLDIDGTPLPDPNTLAVGFHRSYMPVVAKGCVGFDDLDPTQASCDELAAALDPGKHYYVSVLPRAGYSIGGAPFKGGESPTVYVNADPIPPAQITVFVFEDNFPINNAPDLPAEDPAGDPARDMSGFTILVEDAGGRWGASAGMLSLDVFGNPLGTTYDAAGSVTGFEPLITGPDGRITIKNLAPGKYGIQAVPPIGSGYQQTSTIEGTRVIDAWVKPNEPPYFAEFGPPGFHVFIGFIKEFADTSVIGAGGASISGQVVNLHLSRPPEYAFQSGSCFGHTTPWVGLNDLSVGIGKGIYAAPTDENCNFTIPDVPDGNYQLVVWDSALDLIFAFKGITIIGGECNTPDASCNLNEVPVFQWFTRQEHFVFNDVNGDGFWDDGELPMSDQAVILRWRDGTVYQENVTDFAGAYAFDQIFPFFSWLVTEVDFTRMQATGVTVTVDNGGLIDPANPWTYGGQLNPQDQTNPDDPVCADPGICVETADYRVEKGTVLTQAFQGFIGQTSVFEWGKRHYPDIAPSLAANGGISGIVFYAVTRAENDPEVAGAEVWEPGIPGVTVNLYESLGVDPVTGVGIRGPLLATTTTDSWDDSIPEGCKWGNGATGSFVFDPDGPGPITPVETDCYDGLRVFNQTRPGVFDGGYAFGPEFDCPGEVCADYLDQDQSNPTVGYLKRGDYIVEAVALPGYEILKPEDKNVDFGDEFGPPHPELLPPQCVGELHLIPPYLTLVPDEQIPSPFAGTMRPLCDRKLVTVSGGFNAASDFFLFTEVPIASQAFGFILDDTQNEFDPNSPQFGEKFAPPFLPISIRDWTGREIGRTLSDQFGRYNFLAPSTATPNIGSPSGMAPNMLTTCMNEKTLPDGSIDPNHNQIYSQFCYTFQYMPGVTTYLDTPVVPVGAFAGADQFPVDCEFPDGTPRIYSVSAPANGVGGGPYLPAATGSESLDFQSLGDAVLVPNPHYCNPVSGECPAGADTLNKFVSRDYGFGDSPIVMLVGEDGTEHLLTGVTGTNVSITGTVPSLPDGTYQMTITRGDNGLSSLTGVTVQVGLLTGARVIPVMPSALPLATPIQDAIDTSRRSNDLILVHPGQYEEMVIMWKPVRLQGFGEGTILNAINAPAEKLEIVRGKIEDLVLSGAVNLLPGQEGAFGGIEPATLFTETGAGIFVLTAASGGNRFVRSRNRGARIDGFTIVGADNGGGIVVNGNASYLEISNNRIAGNLGFFGGGIRVGHPELISEQAVGTFGYTDAHNDWVKIHNNQVIQNGNLGGSGAGISMCTGSDSYEVTDNFVCGNFSLRNGGGIGHIGLSDRAETGGSSPPGSVPLIKENIVIFNEIFNQGLSVSGGGIFIGGAAPLTPGALSPGSGNVKLISNLIQGNGAGAGDGGGIRLALVNGEDVAANPDNTPPRTGSRGRNDPPVWYTVDVFNNMIVNNVAGLAGGGISLQDAVDVRAVNNTVANNNSTATAGEAFSNDPNQSNPQPAGIVSRRHSNELIAAIGSPADPRLGVDFSNPVLYDNIVWDNRSFFFLVEEGIPGDPAAPSLFGLCPDLGGLGLTCPTPPIPDEIAVLGTGGSMTCSFCLETGDPDPLFVREYHNGGRASVAQPELTTGIQAPAAFDEGGNFIRPHYGPLSINVDLDTATAGDQVSDYHIRAGSPAMNAGTDLTGTFPELATDFDGDARPGSGAVDIGADELTGGEGVATDTVNVTLTGHAGFFQVLWVFATSDALSPGVIATSDALSSGVTLTAHWEDAFQMHHEVLTPVFGGYLLVFGSTGNPVGEVVITSSGGGTDSAPVPFP